MGIIRVPLQFEGSKGERQVYALFDSGATFSCLHPDVAKDIEEASLLQYYRPQGCQIDFKKIEIV